MAVMKRPPISAHSPLALGALAVLAAALAGCGSQTSTVSVASSPAATPPTATTAKPSTTVTSKAATTPTSTTPAPTGTAGGTAAPGATHTAPEPEFTQQEAHAEGLSEALALLKAKGYTANETSQYHPNQTLRVLVGTQTGSSDDYGQQAFFFVGGRYIGTDTKEPSATVSVVSQSDTEVTLGYPLYRSGDPLSQPQRRAGDRPLPAQQRQARQRCSRYRRPTPPPA